MNAVDLVEEQIIRRYVAPEIGGKIRDKLMTLGINSLRSAERIAKGVEEPEYIAQV